MEIEKTEDSSETMKDDVDGEGDCDGGEGANGEGDCEGGEGANGEGDCEGGEGANGEGDDENVADVANEDDCDDSTRTVEEIPKVIISSPSTEETEISPLIGLVKGLTKWLLEAEIAPKDTDWTTSDCRSLVTN